MNRREIHASEYEDFLKNDSPDEGIREAVVVHFVGTLRGVWFRGQSKPRASGSSSVVSARSIRRARPVARAGAKRWSAAVIWLRWRASSHGVLCAPVVAGHANELAECIGLARCSHRRDFFRAFPV